MALAELALGLLDEHQRRDTAAHVAACGACHRELTALRQRAASIALGVRPARGATVGALRERILVASRTGRPLPSFARAVARLFATDVARAATWLRQLAGSTEWRPGPAPGIRVWPVTPGPVLRGAVAVFVRGEAGARFPAHRHLGVEHAMVLEGGYRDSATGREVWAGDHATGPAESVHHLEMIGPGCTCAVLVAKGIELVRSV